MHWIYGCSRAGHKQLFKRNLENDFVGNMLLEQAAVPKKYQEKSFWFQTEAFFQLI